MLIFFFRLHPSTERYIFEDVNFNVDSSGRFSVNEFSRSSLWENNCAKIKALASIIDGSWNDILDDSRMLQSLDEELTNATIKSITCKYVCLRCFLLMKDDQEVIRHCSERHREEINPNTVGALTETTLHRRAIKKMKSCRTGQKLLVAFSGVDQAYTQHLEDSNYANFQVSPLENPSENEKVQLRIHDLPTDLPDYEPEAFPQ